MIALRPYQPPADAAAVYALWRAALGRHWPITEADLHQLLTGSPLYQAGDYIVACQGDQIVGFAAPQIDRRDPMSAAIAALFVDPQFQRHGTGTVLHAAALAHLESNGANTVQLGGGYSCFWPGVPANLPAARPFFQAQSWDFGESCYDLAQSMQEYRAPADPPANALIELATPADAPELLEFESAEFPHWLGPFQST